MAGNTFGTIFKVTTFGESHGHALGCIIDGCPAQIPFDEDFLQSELDRRKPGGRSSSVTKRNEADRAKVLSGVFENKTTGTPIAIIIENTDQHSHDYSKIKDCFRPGHGDFTYDAKYGIRDYRGGGRSSGRETCARVAAGAVAKMILKHSGIQVLAWTKRAAQIDSVTFDANQIEKNPLRSPDENAAKLMEEKIDAYRKSGNSCGGIVECVISGVPKGLGEPVFDKADALLAQAMLSIGAIKGIEFGSGFKSADSTGAENNDPMLKGPAFASNNAGGILAGITNGNEIVFRVAVKPVPSIYTKQHTIRTDGSECDIEIEGRHDVCLCPRIVPVVESMAAITMADLLLRNRASRI